MLMRVFHWAAIVVLCVLAVPLTVAVGARIFGCTTLIVQSGSMGRAIPAGSLAISQWTESQDVQVDDVILIERMGTKGILHRVMFLEQTGGRILAQTKGDANEKPDPEPYALPKRVLTPAFSIPWLGYLLGAVATRAGLIVILVGVPTLLLGPPAVRWLFSEDEEESEDSGESKAG